MSTSAVPLKSSAGRPRNAFPSNSRIPLEYCDGPTQRIYAVSAFVFLQSLKLYYWFGISRFDYAAEFFGFLLWLSLDVAFLMALNYLRIPWLELPVLRLIVALFFLTILNFVLFTAREISPTAIALSTFYKVSSYFGVSSFSRADDHAYQDLDDHLLGRHTVLIKPYSSAILNPNDQCYCVPDSSIPILVQPEIPIVFNGSEPYYLEYSVTSFETGKTTAYKLKGPFKDSVPTSTSTSGLYKAKQLEGAKSLYHLLASAAGAYKLTRIQDKDLMDIRFYHDKEVYIVNCPDARIDHHRETLEYCSGKGDVDIPIVVRGLPPWTVTYKRHVVSAGKNVQDQLMIESEPSGYSSPFLKGWSPPATPNYSWAKQHEMNLTVSLGLSTPGEYGFQATKVKDGCGNVIDLQRLVERNLRDPEIRRVNVRGRPSLSMKCDPRVPIKSVDGAPANLGLKIERGVAPFNVGYIYQRSDLDEPQTMPDVQITEAQINDGTTYIDAKLPGLYTLSHVKDAYCEGEVVPPRDCSVIIPARPTVSIESHPINDSCVGAIGVTVDATFTGEGPWEVCYQILLNGKRSLKTCNSSPKPRLNLEFKPDRPGNYEYRFTTVKDRNYKNEKVNLPSVFQNIHPQPSAKFASHQSGMKACRGSSKTLDVELYGTGPWNIEYRMIRGTEIKFFKEESIAQNIATLTLAPFEKDGIYSIDLGKVTDLANRCEKDLNVPDVTVEVSNGPPTASFQCEKPIEFAEGEEVDLPIHLTGGAPWNVSYSLEGEDSLTHAMATSRNALISVNRPGIYELKLISDSFCNGEVVEQARKCEVVYSKRPTMNLMIDSIRFRGGPRENVPEGEIAPSERISREGEVYILPAVCKDADRTLELRLTGKPPFTLRYRRSSRSAKGNRDVSTILEEKSQHSTMRIPILTDESGSVSYHFETISDAVYQNVEVRHEKLPVVFKHLVRAPPTAKLVSTTKQSYCKNEITGAKEKIAIQIQDGVGPYSLAIEIMRPNQAVAEKLYEHDVVPQKGIYEWTLPAKFTEMGLYKVSILRVTDVNGCSDGVASTVEFDILDTPSITPLRSIKDACVGDKIEYSVKGEAPPFKVFYSVNQANHTMSLDSKRRAFSLEATKPGLVSINKVCQTLANKQCCMQPIEEMSVMIWAIPTVKVAGGANLITDLREGDRAEVEATFVGEAPFSWSYVRTEAVYDKERHIKHGKKPRIIEERTIENIPGHKYSFFTAIEGTIVPVWIKDKHCQFGKEMKESK
ncbi:hypothetical protein BGZ76_006352 [Entomortierella beljakovae]|nr:hypothetical protein BGZ76_006352 [Entomortierella beljakovae]